MPEADKSPRVFSRRDFGSAALEVGATTALMSLFHGPAFAKSNQIDFVSQMMQLRAAFNAEGGSRWLAVSPQQSQGNDFVDDNPYAMGSKRSFVPALGRTVWEQELAAHVPFSARIYQTSDNRRVGYVRLPHFNDDDEALKKFGELIARFENETEALVFDEVNNPGGSMFQMYGILAYLTDRALTLPKHELAIDQKDVDDASEVVSRVDAGEAGPKDTPALIAYSRFVLSEIKAGRGLGRGNTKPTYLFGVPEVLPEENHYTKKIVVLINELSFSAAEFLATILADNKRATLFGNRTPGAGGCVKIIRPPGSEEFGIHYITVTWTVAWRSNGQPIQDVGVQPDVSYSITAEDLQSGYGGYRQALLATIGE